MLYIVDCTVVGKGCDCITCLHSAVNSVHWCQLLLLSALLLCLYSILEVAVCALFVYFIILGLLASNHKDEEKSVVIIKRQY